MDWRRPVKICFDSETFDWSTSVAATKKQLMGYPFNEIVDWLQIMREYMSISYRNNLWAACAATELHSLDDGFIDFR